MNHINSWIWSTVERRWPVQLSWVDLLFFWILYYIIEICKQVGRCRVAGRSLQTASNYINNIIVRIYKFQLSERLLMRLHVFTLFCIWQLNCPAGYLYAVLCCVMLCSSFMYVTPGCVLCRLFWFFLVNHSSSSISTSPVYPGKLLWASWFSKN